MMSLRCVLILCLVFFGCSKKEQLKIQVGSSPVLSSAGIFLAKELGYFSEINLDVEITPFNQSGAPMTVLLDSGQLDVAAGNLSTGLFNAIASGAKMKIVADKGVVTKGHGYISLIVKNEHISSGRYKTFVDLKGMRFGLTSLDGVSQQIALEKILKAYNVDLSTVTYVKLSYPAMNVALASGDIDATIQLEPYVTSARLSSIATPIANVFDYYPNQQSAAIIFSEKFTKKTNYAKAFMQAYLKGVRVYEDAFTKGINKEKVVEILKKYVKVGDNKVWDELTPVGINPNGHLNKVSLKADIDWYFNKGFLKKKILIDDFVDESFVNEALSKIGRYE